MRIERKRELYSSSSRVVVPSFESLFLPLPVPRNFRLVVVFFAVVVVVFFAVVVVVVVVVFAVVRVVVEVFFSLDP